MRDTNRKRTLFLRIGIIGIGTLSLFFLFKTEKKEQKPVLPETETFAFTEREEEKPKDTETAAVSAMEQQAEKILNLSAGEMAAVGILDENLVNRLFFAAGIQDEIFTRIYGYSYVENETIGISELSYLKMLYYGFDGNTYVGEMIVNQKIEAEVLSIFKTLYENCYPIEKMVLIDEYQADDEASMQDNNTSAFNYRTIAGSTKLSNHSYGMAIDLNPKYNPYVKKNSDGTIFCQPATGMEYADRSQGFDYKIDENDLAYRLFTEAGFTWGGSFQNVKDYQHFEKSGF